MAIGDAGASADRDFVAELCRWEDSGAGWEVVARTQRGVTVALMRCDGGEEADRFTSDDPKVLEFVARRRRSGPAWE